MPCKARTQTLKRLSPKAPKRFSVKKKYFPLLLITQPRSLKFSFQISGSGLYAVTKTAIEMVKVTRDENSIRSYTRRMLAWAIMGNFCFLITLGALIWKYDLGWAKHILACAGLLSNLALAVGIFYFGYYGVQSIVGKAKDK